MALKDWTRFHSKSYDAHGIHLWEKDNGNWKVSVSKFYPDAHINIPYGYEISVTSKNEARKGYPHSRVGITKAHALKFAKTYMARH